MKYTKMYETLRKVLDKDEQIDYAMSSKMAALIELWSLMYAGRSPWINCNVKNAGIPEAVASEIARLVTLEVKSSVSGSAMAAYMDKYYKKVINSLRIQTEYAFAKGGMIFKPYVTQNGLSIQYIQADSFFPLEYDSEQITRCAFLDQFRKNNTIYSRVELHSIKNGLLDIRNRVFASRTDGVLGTEIDIGSVPKWGGLAKEMVFQGIQKLPFGYFRVPLGNNEDTESPFGVSVFARAKERIKEADHRYTQISWEYESKEAAVHIAQSLLKRRSDTGSLEYPGGKERLYRAVDYNTGATDKPLLDVFSPQIRDTSLYNGWNQQMRLIEFECNLAYGTLSDPNNTDKTAEEIRASKQRSYSFVSTCQSSLQAALEDLVEAMVFWCRVYDLAPEGDIEQNFEWDDSIVNDKEKERQSDRAEVAMGAMQLWEYRQKYYNETEEKAKAAVQQGAEVIE